MIEPEEIDRIPSSEKPGATHIVRTVYCCRPWPIVMFNPVGRCGLCGERPR